MAAVAVPWLLTVGTARLSADQAAYRVTWAPPGMGAGGGGADGEIGREQEHLVKWLQSHGSQIHVEVAMHAGLRGLQVGFARVQRCASQHRDPAQS